MPVPVRSITSRSDSSPISEGMEPSSWMPAPLFMLSWKTRPPLQTAPGHPQTLVPLRSRPHAGQARARARKARQSLTASLGPQLVGTAAVRTRSARHSTSEALDQAGWFGDLMRLAGQETSVAPEKLTMLKAVPESAASPFSHDACLAHGGGSRAACQSYHCEEYAGSSKVDAETSELLVLALMGDETQPISLAY